MNAPHETPRIVTFDIESTNLKGNFGYCLCFGYKQLGWKRAKVISVLDYPQHKNDPTNDAALMRAAHDILTNHADIIVSYYGKGFDRKFLNTRMLAAGLRPLPPLSHEHVDLYYTAKHNLALHSNRLASVSEFLGTADRKTPLDGQTWVRASAGHAPSIRYVIDHCRADVEVLEQCYVKLLPFIRQHPRVGGKYACKNCGGVTFQYRGYGITKSSGRSRRRVCKTCWTWSEVPA